MKNSKRILILIFIAQYSFFSAQNLTDNRCIYSETDLNYYQIFNQFPYDSATKIALVSFYYSSFKESIDENSKITRTKGQDSLPQINNKLDYKNLLEYKELEFPSILELSNILYRYSLAKNVPISNTDCYMPRNAIVFLNTEDEIVAYIEICFECSKMYSFPKFDFGEMCSGKLKMLKDFFIQNGLSKVETLRMKN